MDETFKAFKRGAKQFLAIRIDGGSVYILDDCGVGYGSYWNIESFDNFNGPKHPITPIGGIRLSHRVVERIPDVDEGHDGILA